MMRRGGLLLLVMAGCEAIVGVEEVSPETETTSSSVGSSVSSSASGAMTSSSGAGGMATSCPPIDGLLVHYRADDLDLPPGDPVMTWPSSGDKAYDLLASDFGNNVVPIDNAPTLIDNAVRGHAATHFRVIESIVDDAPKGNALEAAIPVVDVTSDGAATGEPVLTVLLVAKHSGEVFEQQPLVALHYGEPAANGPGIRIQVHNQQWEVDLCYGATSPPPANDIQAIYGNATANWTVLTAVKRIDSYALRLDGVPSAEAPMTHPALPIQDPLLLVGSSNGYRHWDGHIAELAIYKGALDEPALQAAEGCLGDRYGITISR